MTPRLRTTLTAGAGIAAVALASTAFALPSSAVGSTGTTPHYLAAAGWLSTQFVTSGTHLPAPSGDHFESVYGGKHYANYGENDDVIFALAAAKTGARKAAAAKAYLTRNVEAYTDIKATSYGPYDGSIGKLAVGALVQGGTATDFGGYNLLAALKKDECAVGATTCTPGSAANIYSSTSESFVLIAEARANATYAPSAAAKTYFASLQCASGGFTGGTTACGTGAADIDSTSYAIMAMQAMGTTGPSLSNAVTWLQGQQSKAGYWKSQNIANVNSTGLATSALQGVGAGLGLARHWLTAQQQGRGPGAGALRYGGKFAPTTTSATSLSVLGTAQGLVGLIDGSTLAKVTWTGSTAGVHFFKPTVHAKSTEKRGKTYSVYGAGFAAGEKVSITRAGTHIATVTVGPDGRYDTKTPIAAKAKTGHLAYKITGLSSGLTVTLPVQLVA